MAAKITEPKKISLLDMVQGAIKERVDVEMSKIIDNIADINTPAAKPRSLTLTVKFIPDDDRQFVAYAVTAKSTLQSTSPLVSSLYIDSSGESPVVYEMTPQIPGQHSFDGEETGEAAVLKLVSGGNR